jgi:hypothetical protein
MRASAVEDVPFSSGSLPWYGVKTRKMPMIFRLLTALSLLMATAPVVEARSIIPDTKWRVIDFDPGGVIGHRFRQEMKAEKAGAGYVIRGTCASMCTIRLAYVIENRLCTYPNAKWKFHAIMPITGGRSTTINGTNAILSTYPPEIASWFKENIGYNATFSAKTLTGQELHDMTDGTVPLCGQTG